MLSKLIKVFSSYSGIAHYFLDKYPDEGLNLSKHVDLTLSSTNTSPQELWVDTVLQPVLINVHFIAHFDILITIEQLVFSVI